MKLDITNAIYNTEDAARAHLEKQLWPDGPFCPHCGSFAATKLEGKAHRKGLYQCNEGECREQFSVTVGTVFERSKIPLHKWVLASHLMGASKKGMSSKQIERMLGVTYKTAWFMTMRLRGAMTDPDAGPLGGEGKVVENDETLVGGKKKNVHRGKPEPKKDPVHALVERGGKMRAKHIADVTARTLRENLKEMADRKSELHTDDSLANVLLSTKPSTIRLKRISRTALACSLRRRSLPFSSAAFMARSIQSVSSICSATLMSFRWNNRLRLGVEEFERAEKLLKGAKGKRLTYRPTDKRTQPGQADA